MYDIIGPGLNALVEYLSAHVLTCLVPAFFISGAIAVLVSKGTVIKYFSKMTALPIAVSFMFQMVTAAAFYGLFIR